MSLNVETGEEPVEPPQRVWDQAAESLGLNEDQARAHTRPLVAAVMVVCREAAAQPPPPPPHPNLYTAPFPLPQAVVFVELDRWWVSTSAALARRRRELAGAALASPGDLALQAASLAGYEAVQARHIECTVAARMLCVTSLLSPEQLAEVWVACWPFCCNLTAILDACKRRHAAGGGA